jgi:hypothetical protein
MKPSKELVEMARKDDLTAEIARELYDRFVMGGWSPEDAYEQIDAWLAESGERLVRECAKIANTRHNVINFVGSTEVIGNAISEAILSKFGIAGTKETI